MGEEGIIHNYNDTRRLDSILTDTIFFVSNRIYRGIATKNQR